MIEILRGLHGEHEQGFAQEQLRDVDGRRALGVVEHEKGFQSLLTNRFNSVHHLSTLDSLLFA
jgi:hypothetical protein